MVNIFDKKVEKYPSKPSESLSFILVMFVVTFAFFTYREGAAKRYQMEGVITKITWRCTNRDKPTITFEYVDGKEYSVCYDSIVLRREDIKVGDYIVKYKGSYTALVNGKEVRFASKTPLDFIWD